MSHLWGEFRNSWIQIAGEVHQTAVDKGFWDGTRNNAELIALMHSELSECLEALRLDNPRSTKIPIFTEAEEELADLVIRVMDAAMANGWDVGGAIETKARYNKDRPHKHGKAF